jgi:hypothetical protein
VTTDIEKRLNELEDQLALRKLINSYHWRADHFDWSAWADCFTEDAEFDFSGEFGVMCGRQAIHDICKDNMDHVYGEMQHVIVNLDFEVTGENTAAGHGNLIFAAQGWRISRARLDSLWTRGENAGDVFSDAIPQASAG